ENPRSNWLRGVASALPAVALLGNRDSMRWGIRNQVLLPPLTLLAGVSLASVITAFISSGQAWARVQNHVRNVGQVLGSAHFPLTPRVLEQMKGLSGAEYVFISPDHRITTTLPDVKAGDLLHAAVARDWRDLELHSQLLVGGRQFLCAG